MNTTTAPTNTPHEAAIAQAKARNFRPTGRRRVLAQKVDMDNYTYTLVDEAGHLVDVFHLCFCDESGGWWTLVGSAWNADQMGSDRKGILVSNLRNWEAGGDLPK